MLGTGTSRISRPGPAVAFTTACIVRCRGGRRARTVTAGAVSASASRSAITMTGLLGGALDGPVLAVPEDGVEHGIAGVLDGDAHRLAGPGSVSVAEGVEQQVVLG